MLRGSPSQNICHCWDDRGSATREGLLSLHPRGRTEATVGRLAVLSSEARRRLGFETIAYAQLAVSAPYRSDYLSLDSMQPTWSCSLS